jgi:hypothetical protein
MLSNQIVQYDPLVSDTACHTRAPYLVYLARKSKSSELDQTEKDYLDACETLTAIKLRKQDAFGVITDERTDNTKIPARFIAANSSNTKKNTFLAQQKTFVAKATLAFLQENCKDMKMFAGLKDITFNIPHYKMSLPVLPLYVSAKMMLNFAAKQSIPLVANIKRLKSQEDSFALEGASSLIYRFDTEKKAFALQEAEQDQEAIAINIVSCYVENTEKEVDGFLTAKTFQLFLEAFKREDIALLIMIAAVGHPQYPSTAEPPKKSAEPPPAEEKQMANDASSSSESAASAASAASIEPLTPLAVNLNECATSEYNQLETLARRYGFFRENSQYITISQQGVLSRPKSCLSFFVDHIYASTIQTSQLATARLNELRQELKEPKEILLEGFKKK